MQAPEFRLLQLVNLPMRSFNRTLTSLLVRTASSPPNCHVTSNRSFRLFFFPQIFQTALLAVPVRQQHRFFAASTLRPQKPILFPQIFLSRVWLSFLSGPLIDASFFRMQRKDADPKAFLHKSLCSDHFADSLHALRAFLSIFPSLFRLRREEPLR